MLAPGLLLAQNASIVLNVDASDVQRRVIHARMQMPVKPGPLTLLYPKWIPGEHMPSGPITNFVGLKISSGGQTISWKRDSVNMFAFHVDVPAGVSSLDIAYDFLAPEYGDFSSGGSVIPANSQC